MSDLLYLGLVCILAAVVGGGLKWKGIEMPVVTSYPRQALLGATGFVLLGVGLSAAQSEAAVSDLPRATQQTVTINLGGLRPPKSPNLIAPHCVIYTDQSLFPGMIFDCFRSSAQCEQIAASNNGDTAMLGMDVECRQNPGFYCLDYKSPEGQKTNCYDRLDRCLHDANEIESSDTHVISDCERRRLSSGQMGPLLLGLFGGLASLSWIWVGPRLHRGESG